MQKAHALGIRTHATAYTGSAAINLEGGQTLLSLLGISMTSPASNISLPHLTQKSVTSLRVAFRYGHPDQTSMVFIYEISLVTAILLSMIDKHLKDNFDSSQLFGVIAVISWGISSKWIQCQEHPWLAQ